MHGLLGTSIKIIAPDIFNGDAVGNYCIDLRNVFQKAGAYARIYAKNHSDGIIEINSFFNDIRDQDFIFLSFSIYDPNLEKIANLSNKKIAYFHGITPPKYLKRFDPVTANLCREGLDQRHLLSKFDHVVCNSVSTANTLNGLVDRSVISIFPPFVESRVKLPCSFRIDRQRQLKDGINILMLGRVVPHKSIEDGIEIAKALAEFGIAVKLIVAGSLGGEDYFAYLVKLANEISHLNIEFLGYVNDLRKIELLSNSDLLMSTSHHEGYGIPIIEAMGIGTPVLVRRGSITGELVGNCCLEFDDPLDAATTINNYIRNDAELQRLVDRGLKKSEAVFESVSELNTVEFYRNLF
jgi:glycosyltransferase involved in cell wall biosynthesis